MSTSCPHISELRVSRSQLNFRPFCNFASFQNLWHSVLSGCACADCLLLKQIPEKWHRTVPIIYIQVISFTEEVIEQSNGQFGGH